VTQSKVVFTRWFKLPQRPLPAVNSYPAFHVLMVAYRVDHRVSSLVYRMNTGRWQGGQTGAVISRPGGPPKSPTPHGTQKWYILISLTTQKCFNICRRRPGGTNVHQKGFPGAITGPSLTVTGRRRAVRRACLSRNAISVVSSLPDKIE